MAKKPRKSPTFRQRLRETASTQLDRIQEQAFNALLEVRGDSGLSVEDLAKLCAGGSTKSLRHDMVTQLCNGMEAELEAIYNQQLDLPVETPDGQD